MGRWNTLHLFDVKKFYNDITPTLRGEKGCLDKDYVEFLSSYRTGGISKLERYELIKIIDISISKIIEISNQFDLSFTYHKIYNNIRSWDDQRKYLNENQYYYEFNAFFEYYIFKYCSDFSPYIACSKYGLLSNLDPKRNSVGYEILCILENYDNFFCSDGNGIVSWISIEDTEILSNCKEDFFSRYSYKDNDFSYLEGFMKFVEVATINELGLIRGQDVREWTLEKLPQFKLVQKGDWNHFKFKEVLIFR
ncbi:hypothetical protein GCM10022393_34450 [Aquimarina addita]|uniref:Uncharacterized protein n=1 Tax=Aquimarina addita TaxID=870485 RepID=A0ABP6USG4_9FLAO